jgi:hypothetical protein
VSSSQPLYDHAVVGGNVTRQHPVFRETLF